MRAEVEKTSCVKNFQSHMKIKSNKRVTGSGTMESGWVNIIWRLS